jgi:hypothetical protein
LTNYSADKRVSRSSCGDTLEMILIRSFLPFRSLAADIRSLAPLDHSPPASMRLTRADIIPLGAHLTPSDPTSYHSHARYPRPTHSNMTTHAPITRRKHTPTDMTAPRSHVRQPRPTPRAHRQTQNNTPLYNCFHVLTHVIGGWSTCFRVRWPTHNLTRHHAPAQ